MRSTPFARTHWILARRSGWSAIVSAELVAAVVILLLWLSGTRGPDDHRQWIFWVLGWHWIAVVLGWVHATSQSLYDERQSGLFELHELAPLTPAQRIRAHLLDAALPALAVSVVPAVLAVLLAVSSGLTLAVLLALAQSTLAGATLAALTMLAALLSGESGPRSPFLPVLLALALGLFGATGDGAVVWSLVSPANWLGFVREAVGTHPAWSAVLSVAGAAMSSLVVFFATALWALRRRFIDRDEERAFRFTLARLPLQVILVQQWWTWRIDRTWVEPPGSDAPTASVATLQLLYAPVGIAGGITVATLLAIFVAFVGVPTPVALRALLARHGERSWSGMLDALRIPPMAWMVGLAAVSLSVEGLSQPGEVEFGAWAGPALLVTWGAFAAVLSALSVRGTTAGRRWVLLGALTLALCLGLAATAFDLDPLVGAMPGSLPFALLVVKDDPDPLVVSAAAHVAYLLFGLALLRREVSAVLNPRR